MSQLYLPVLVVHVVIAILGMGTVAAIAIIAATGRRQGSTRTVLTWLSPLLRYATLSLALMLVTGVLMGIAAGAAAHQTWWFRGSALLLLPTGALLGQARRAVRQALANESDGVAAIRRVEGIAYGVCSLVALIAVLMEAKPF